MYTYVATPKLNINYSIHSITNSLCKALTVTYKMYYSHPVTNASATDVISYLVSDLSDLEMTGY